MANIKITDLTAYTDPESTDVLPIVDITNDATKKVSIADLMENAGAGAEATPGIAFDGDPNTGIYRPAADQLAISTGGTQRILIDDSGVVTIAGDLTVNGTTTTVNSTTVTVDDKNIELGSVGTPTDTTADGGGITLKGATDKTLNWVNSTDSWTSSENVDLASGKTYKIAGTDVLSGSTLGSGVTGSSLTSVGTITTGVWNGTALTADAIGADAINGSKIADDSIDSEHYVDGSIDNVHVSASAAIAGTKISADFGAQDLTVDTDVLHVDATNDRVGIGITSPVRPLHLHEDSSSACLMSFTNTTTGAGSGDGMQVGIDNSENARVWQLENGNLDFGTNNALAARIDSSGRLLVGINSAVTSTAGTYGPSYAYIQNLGNTSNSAGAGILALGRNEATADVNTAEGLGAIVFTDNQAGNYASIEGYADGASSTDDYPGKLIFSTTADAGSSPTERMRITSSGNVNIGDVTAQYSLGRTLGSLVVQESSASNIALVNSTNDAYTYLTNDGTGFYIQNSYGSTAGHKPIIFEVAGEQVRIDTSGRLLVGTTSAVNADVEIIGQFVHTSGAALALARNDTEVVAGNQIGAINFYSNDTLTSGGFEECAVIKCNADADHTDSSKASRLVFETTASGAESSTERLRITSDGTLQLRNSPGIDFSQIQGAPDAGTSTSEVLDSYEEGTWTPTIIRATTAPTITYTYRTGSYVKIGRSVLVYFDLNMSANSGGSGRFSISGLPFTTATDSNSGGYGSPQFRASTAFNTDARIYNTSAFHSSNNIDLLHMSSSGVETNTTVGTGRITGWSVYLTND